MANEDTGGSALERVLGGGLPQILLGPAGAAISRLVGATVEIPAAWLEARAQSIRDETEARSLIMKALAENRPPSRTAPRRAAPRLPP